MSEASELLQLRDDILQEIHKDAVVIAKKLFGDGQGHADAHVVQRGEFLHYLRTMWNSGPDQGVTWRNNLRQQIGDEAFVCTAAEVHGLPHPKISDTGVTWNDPLEGLPDVGPEEMLMTEHNFS